MLPEDRVFSIPEAAQFLRVGRSTVYILIKAGKLPIRKLGNRSLILGKDLTDLIERLPKTLTSKAEV